MPNYTPPPPRLDHLNPIQRYMQKGQLDRQDWIRLIALVLAYFVLRPYIQKGAKWLFGGSQVAEGEKEQQEYVKRRLAKVGPNTIRSGKVDDIIIEDIEDDEDEAITSGSKANAESAVVNRKKAGKKSKVEKMVNWEDEPIETVPVGEQTDVTEWLNKWDKKVEAI